MDWAVVRREFPAAERAIYFDSAAAALMPCAAQEAMSAYYAGIPFNAGLRLSPAVSYGGVGDEEAAEVTAAVVATRGALAELLGTTASDVAFTKNATEAINLVVQGLSWESGEEVIISEVEHQSGTLPWVRAAREYGLRLRWVRADASGQVDPAEVERLISARTRLIGLIHVSSALGTVEPVETVGQIAASHGVLYLVDAAQSVGRIPVDVSTINCDFLVLSGRKGLLGPQGIGALVGRNGSLQRLRPMSIGSRSALMLDSDENGVQYTLADAPFHLESGALNAGGAIGLGASIAFLEHLGWPLVFDRIHRLGLRLWERLASEPGIQIYGDPAHMARTGIVSLYLISGS